MKLYDKQELALLDSALEQLSAGFEHLPGAPEGASAGRARAGQSTVGAGLPGALPDPLTPDPSSVLHELARRLHDNYPYHHPLYAGQMLKPPHPVARLACALTQTLNPNNHAVDGGRATSALEKEAVAQLAALFGWSRHLGHLTGGGTMANLEALWVAGQLAPDTVVLASRHAHYTHSRLSAVLGLRFEAVDVDAAGRLDLAAVEARLRRGGVGTVVATAGTTGFGAVDPVAELLELRARYGFRLHADAAYGGYFRLAAAPAPDTACHLRALQHVDSLVVDPHKHGLQPYGCGAVLYADPTVGALYRHDSPYTYFTSSELHLGEISLECSRAGAAAAALWATQRLLPPVPGGRFAQDLDRCVQAAGELHRRLCSDGRFLTLMAPELDILVWAPAAATAAAVSESSRRQFQAAAERGLHLALVDVEADLAARHWPQVDLSGAERVTCLRSCLMKPEHLDWLDRIWSLLCAAA